MHASSKRPSQSSDTGSEKGDSKADLELAHAALRHDEPALSRFLERVGCIARILAVKNRRMGSPLEREELADLGQEVLFTVWRKLERYDGQYDLEAWVYRFCHLDLLKRLRDLRRDEDRWADWATDERSADTAETAASPVDMERLFSGLESLDPEEDVVIRLKTFEGLTFPQTAERLELSPNTVKSCYYRGIRKLKRRLGESAGGESGRAW